MGKFGEARDRDDLDTGWHGENLRSPVRTILGRVALTNFCPIKFGDPSRVVDAGIDHDDRVIEFQREDFEHGLDEITAGDIIGEIDPIQEMSAIPAIRQGWVRPALWAKPGRDSVAAV